MAVDGMALHEVIDHPQEASRVTHDAAVGLGRTGQLPIDEQLRSLRYHSMLRRWWSGYWVAPLGTVAGLALLTVFDVVTRTRPFTGPEVEEIVQVTLVGVLVSYVVGLGLLPAFVSFEISRWTGSVAYVLTGAISGMVTGWVITYPSPLNPTLHGLSSLLGVLCAIVFSVRLEMSAPSDANPSP